MCVCNEKKYSNKPTIMLINTKSNDNIIMKLVAILKVIINNNNNSNMKNK